MRQKILSLTAGDFKWTYYRGSGSGGQKRNKTSNCVRCIHILSGASAYSENGRSQLKNKQMAFRKTVETKVFRDWLKIESMRKLGIMEDIERKVDKEMESVQVEFRKDGAWIAESD